MSGPRKSVDVTPRIGDITRCRYCRHAIQLRDTPIGDKWCHFVSGAHCPKFFVANPMDFFL